MEKEKLTNKTYYYRGYWVESKYRQWYSSTFKGSFATKDEFRRYIDGRIARGNLKENIS